MNWRVHAAIVIVFAIVACRAPATEPRPAPPSPTLPPMSVLTPDTAEVRDRLDPLIGRIVLTTAIGQDESPQNEVTTVPSDVRQLYLAVRVSDLPAGARLSAVWLRGTSQIERTERDVAEALSGARWIALGLGAERGLAAGEYVVRLYLDDRFIDSLVFTVGRGQQSTETEASLVFATEPPSDSGVIEALTVFPVGTTRVVAILTDVPSDTGGSLWSRWSVDGRVLTELGADEVRSAFVRTFTWQRTDPLSPGDYTVQVFLDQRLLAEGQFSVAGATPTPEPARATVEELRIVRAIEPGSGTPVGASVRQIQTPARVYLAMLVRDVQPTDELLVVWEREGVPVAQQPLTGLSLAFNWISLPFDIPAETGSGPVLYRVVVSLNGVTAGEATLSTVPAG